MLCKTGSMFSILNCREKLVESLAAIVLFQLPLASAFYDFPQNAASENDEILKTGKLIDQGKSFRAGTMENENNNQFIGVGPFGEGENGR